MNQTDINAITGAFSDAWAQLFNAPVYIKKYIGPSTGQTVNNVYQEVKQKAYETFGPLNGSIQYQPTLEELNEQGLRQPANAMISFVFQDLQKVVGDKGTTGYTSVSTQDLVEITWVDGNKRTQRIAEFTPQTQFGTAWVFLNVGVVDVLT